MHWPFKINQTYHRRQAIHQVYGGQEQSGIVTPAGAPAIFIFTGRGGKVGYHDRWEGDGSLRYTGEGQIGDMKMKGGNKAIRDHAEQGRDLLVFEKAGSGKPVRFLGAFYCAGWETERQLDRNGSERDAIVFHLVPADRIALNEEVAADEAANMPPASLETLRTKAYAAAKAAQSPSQATKNVYERSRSVRDYVLARAKGTCEACGTAAPFVTKLGAPYLEPHHIRRLSDGGPDDPRHVGAVCPNCHRRAHYSLEAGQFNLELAAKVLEREKTLDSQNRFGGRSAQLAI